MGPRFANVVAVGEIARVLRPGGVLALMWNQSDDPSPLPEAYSRRISELHDEGLTLVLVTHDPTVAARADRLITVKDGEVVADERLSGVGAEEVRVVVPV